MGVTVNRRYVSPRRQEQARQTRRAILDAAATLFVDNIGNERGAFSPFRFVTPAGTPERGTYPRPRTYTFGLNLNI